MKRLLAPWPLGLALLSLQPLTAAAQTTPSQEAQASDNAAPILASCFQASPLASQTPSDLQSTPLSVTAKRLIGTNKNVITYDGDVSVRQGTRSLSADKAIVNRQQQSLDAQGNINYEDTSLAMTASRLQASLTQNTLSIDDAQYRLQAMPGRGDAKQISTHDQRTILLTDASFTTCPPGQESWLMSADRIVLDTESEWGDAYNSVIRLGGVPVLYVPYFTFPLSDRRKSGLLFPTFHNSTKNGFDFAQPVYWNIKPNMDATFTPRYLGDRGYQLQTEWRHLTEHQYNQVNVEYLPSDDRLTSSDNDRALFYWNHSGMWNEHWRTHVDYTYVSDDNYFNDLNSEVGTKTDNRIERTGSVSYLTQNWDMVMDVSRIQVFGDYEDPYRTMPRLRYTYRAPDLPNPVSFNFASEVTQFEPPNSHEVSATRFHFEPTLTLKENTPAMNLLAETKLYQTFYRQHDIQRNDPYKQSVSRTLPSLRLYGALNFEREEQWFGEDYQQTFQPQIQYLYVPYKNQNDIGIYDTVPLQDDYQGLFRPRRYAGLDRIADANQLTIGATTRWLDPNNKEKVRFSLGQIIYLEKSDVTAVSDRARERDNQSALAMALGVNTGPYSFYGELQQDVSHGQTNQGELRMEYSPEDSKLVQLSYHYTPDTYALNGIRTTQRQEINQLGVATSWPITSTLQGVAAHYRDMKLNRSIESMVGVKYESCCWSLQLLWYRRLNSYFDDPDSFEPERHAFDAGIQLQFEFRGLGSGNNSGASMLDNSLFGSRRNYYLNN